MSLLSGFLLSGGFGLSFEPCLFILLPPIGDLFLEARKFEVDFLNELLCQV